MPKTTHQRTVHDKTIVECTAEEIEAILREHLKLSPDAKFNWNVDRYEDFHGVEIISEFTEEQTQ